MTNQSIEQAVNSYLYADGANDHHDVLVALLNVPNQDIAGGYWYIRGDVDQSEPLLPASAGFFVGSEK